MSHPEPPAAPTATHAVGAPADIARTRFSPAGVWLLAAAASAVVFYLWTELRALGGGFGLPLDDSFIHLQFARNLAAGHGLSYNPGDLVTGSTSPLWTALLALLAYLPGNAVIWAQLAGALLYLAAVDAVRRLALELDLPPGLAVLAGGLTLATGWMVWSALSGMEVPLFTVLSLWGMVLHVRERRADLAAGAAGGADQAAGEVPLAPAVLALGALARPEGLLLLGLSFADRCLLFARRAGAGGEGGDGGDGGDGGADGEGGEVGDSGSPAGDRALSWRRPRWRRLAVGAGLAACVLAGPVLFYRLAGGSFLPTTFSAKGGHLRSWIPNLGYIDTVVGIFLRPQPIMTLLAGGGVMALAARLGCRRDRGLLPALWLVILPLCYSTFSPSGNRVLVGNFGRYYFPLIPVVIVLGLLTLEGAAGLLARRLPVRLLLIALLFAPTVYDLAERSGFYAINLQNVDSCDVQAARWLAPRLPPQAVLAVNDIGVFRYLLPNRVIDLAGIANPELSREVSAQVERGVPFEEAMAAAVSARRPDYIAIFPAWLPRLEGLLGLRPLLRLHVERNITMGASDLAVYETPWNRYPLRAVQ